MKNSERVVAFSILQFEILNSWLKTKTPPEGGVFLTSKEIYFDDLLAGVALPLFTVAFTGTVTTGLSLSLV